MNERQATVLVGLVGEYIRHARPLGSRYLVQRFAWAESAATIRADLHELEDEGYIFQPHTSAGRIPTDRGYRFYVDAVPRRSLTSVQEENLEEAVQRIGRHRRYARQLGKVIAELSHTAAITGWLPDTEVYEAGFSQLCQYPETGEMATLREVTHVLDTIDQHLESFSETGRHTTVFIGQENQLFATDHISIIARTVTLTGRKDRLVVVLLGPKRMPYQKHLALLDGIATLFSKNV
jgi:transcriptional regulator of heat shock response